MGKTRKKVLFMAAVILISLVTMELAFRLAGFLPSAAEPDKDLGWRWAAGARYRFEEEGFSEGRFNRFGMRDVERAPDKPAGVRRVALLGDSFAEGLQVPLERTFAFLSEQRLRGNGVKSEILNFARSGMGPTEELIVLQRDALRLAPDAVCLVYLPGNDISDALPRTTTDPSRPFARPADGGVVITRDFLNTRGYRLRRLINPLKRHSALVSWALARVRRLQQERIRKTVLPADPNPLVAPQGVTSLFTGHPEALYEEALAVNLAVLDEVARVCSSNEIPLGVVVLPTYLYFSPEALESAGIDPEAVSRRIQDWAADRGVACLALQQPFEKKIAKGARLHFPTGPQPWNVGHFNEGGNELAARLLTPFLTDLLAPRARP